MRAIFSLMTLVLIALPPVAVVLSGNALATTDMPAQAATCLACHSAATSAASGAPQLAGQQATYLQKQLQQFKNGQRGAAVSDVKGQQMAAMAATLSADDINSLARYFSKQQAEVITSSADAALLDQGRRQYIGSCGACHGAKAEGNMAFNAPALSMLSADYITLQLQHFKTGLRGKDKADKPGRQMALFSRNLSEQDMQAVAAYIGAGMP
ncbi:c-type cytochrome [Rheinheimera maricola]|uniref:C-type cytochrome n=1 Tax=Rheinheimera maricola TaxID=2793282 RepID=A0ABS7XG74_9GAMM|nr:c-type cytochrome [Rheinheimera maricola]MBZ9613532.1 c-type cytochrome [Rheinheimera maricola]